MELATRDWHEGDNCTSEDEEERGAKLEEQAHCAKDRLTIIHHTKVCIVFS
jgi:hypothetical protein